MAHGVRAAKLPSSSGTVGPQTAADGWVLYHGFSIRETGGSASVTVVITDGGVSTGNIIEEIVVAQGTAVRQWYGPQGIRALTGLYATITGSGVAAGAIFHS